MRAIHWLFVVSVALFISGIGFIIASGRVVRAAAPAAAAEATAVAPVATVKQIMTGIVQPAAAAIWDSVSTTISERGVEEKMPRTEEDWASVATSAATLAESANLLMLGDRAVDRDEWPKMVRAMADAAGKALAAAEARSVDGILGVGEEINTTCDNCHERYSRE